MPLLVSRVLLVQCSLKPPPPGYEAVSEAGNHHSRGKPPSTGMGGRPFPGRRGRRYRAPVQLCVEISIRLKNIALVSCTYDDDDVSDSTTTVVSEEGCTAGYNTRGVAIIDLVAYTPMFQSIHHVTCPCAAASRPVL